MSPLQEVVGCFSSVPCLEGDIYLVHWRPVRNHASAGCEYNSYLSRTTHRCPLCCMQAVPHPGRQAATPQQSKGDTQWLRIPDLARPDTWQKLPGCAQSSGRSLRTGMLIHVLREMPTDDITAALLTPAE